MIARLEWYNPNAIPCNRISTLVVSLPNFKLEFGPAANSFTFVVEVKRVIPHSELIDLVSDFFIGLPSVLPIYQGPIKPTFDLKLAESP